MTYSRTAIIIIFHSSFKCYFMTNHQYNNHLKYFDSKNRVMRLYNTIIKISEYLPHQPLSHTNPSVYGISQSLRSHMSNFNSHLLEIKLNYDFEVRCINRLVYSAYFLLKISNAIFHLFEPIFFVMIDTSVGPLNLEILNYFKEQKKQTQRKIK